MIHTDPVPTKFTGKKLESASSMDQIFMENRFAFFSIMKFVVRDLLNTYYGGLKHDTAPF